MSWRRVVAAWAGPLTIVAVVLFALRGFVFANQLTNEHPDLLAFWLPRWSFLGRSLASFDIPLWNPYEMAGYRFAADPQSGWLYATPSVLFATLDAGLAMRAMLALQPILAGLGLYGFLRIEAVGRSVATLGGLALAGAMAASEVAISMPFAGAVAWTTMTLVAAAGFTRGTRWSRRVAWIALGGFAWSQVASAHLSHGLAIGTVLVIAYALVQATRATWGRQLVFLGCLPLLSIAVLVPRFQFLGVSSLADGYQALADGGAMEVLTRGGVWSGGWLAFAAAPGAYLGAVCLLAVPLAVRARRRRRLAIPFAGALAGAIVLVALLDLARFRELLADAPYGDVLLHNGGRLRYVALLTLPVLGAVGVQGAIEDRLSWRRCLAWLGAGVALWLVVPLALGGDLPRWALFAAAAVPAIAAITVAARRPRWAPAIVAVLAVELVVSAALSGRVTGGPVFTGLEGYGSLAFQPLRAPDVDLDAFLAPTALVAEIGDERYLTWVPPHASNERGYLEAQEPQDWPMLANTRGTLFEIRDALGYNPVQLPAYWRWIRERNPMPVYYNAAVLSEPTASDLERLDVRYLIVPEGERPPVPGDVVATDAGYNLVDVGTASRWVERRGPEALVVTEPTDGAIVTEAYDPGWQAVTPDGDEVRIEPDGPVMRLGDTDGAARVALSYHDPWVMWSLILGVALWLGLAVIWLGLAIRERDAATPRPGGGAPPR